MLRFISWSDFLFSLSILLVSYWLTIILIFYKRNVINLFTKTTSQPFTRDDENRKSDDDQFERCNACASVLKMVIRGKALEQFDKVSLLKEIKIAMHPFIDFRDTKWQYPIDNLIKHELWQSCSLTVEEMDLESIWEK